MNIYIYINQFFFMYICINKKVYIIYICSILLWIARHYLIVRLIKSYICQYKFILLTEFIIYNLYVYTLDRIQTHILHVQNNKNIKKQTHNVATPFFPSRPGIKLPISYQCHAMKIFNREIQPKESSIQRQTRVGGIGVLDIKYMQAPKMVVETFLFAN